MSCVSGNKDCDGKVGKVHINKNRGVMPPKLNIYSKKLSVWICMCELKKKV